MQKQIADWERERWYQDNLPSFLQTAGPPKVRKCTPPQLPVPQPA